MSCRWSFERYDQDLFRYFDADSHPPRSGLVPGHYHHCVRLTSEVPPTLQCKVWLVEPLVPLIVGVRVLIRHRFSSFFRGYLLK